MRAQPYPIAVLVALAGAAAAALATAGRLPPILAGGALLGLSAAGLAQGLWLRRTLKKAQAAVRTARAQSIEAQRWAAMAEQLAGVGYWRIDAATRKVTWSTEMYRILEPEALVLDMALERLHPDDAERMRGKVAAALARGEDYQDQARLQREDGSWRTLIIRALCEKDAGGRVKSVIGAVFDVTEFKRLETQALESEARFRTLAEKAPDIIARTDLSGRPRYISPARQRILGYRPNFDENASERVHDDDWPRLKTYMRDLILSGREEAAEPIRYRLRHAHGHWLWMETRPAVIFGPDGRAVELIHVTRDVTAAKASEAELEAARAAAEAATHAKSEFLANMSHEIRTPLTSIMGYSSLLGEAHGLPETARIYVQRIASAGTALLSLVNDVLDFSKLEAGQVELEPHPFDPRGFIEDTVELLATEAADKGLSCQASFSGELPSHVLGDSGRLRQILINLIGNAIKFTSTGGVEIKVDHRGGPKGRLSVAVTDTGMGISRADRQKLFQRFSQIDGSTSRGHGGAGLGLAICKGLAELMGGTISVKSAIGRGSTFRLVIPAPVVPSAKAAPTQSALATGLKRARILIVDDVPANRELVRALLTPFGHAFEEAGNGVEAVEAARRSRFDLILMDLQMPGMDGFAATRTIRATAEPNRSTPIVALSANVLPVHVEACMAAGMDDHMAKPIVPSLLAAKVAEWAGAHHPDAGLGGLQQAS